MQPTTAAPTGVNITSPAEGSEVVIGGDMTVGGLAQLEVTELISVTLTSPTGLVLGRARAESTGFSSWQATLAVGPEVSGAADLRARVLDADGAVVAETIQLVRLVVDPAAEGPTLSLFRPRDGQTVVAGYNMFFDGRNIQPANNRVTVALWGENCQVEVARQSFQLRGSGYWQGFLAAPRDLRGPACALAYFGAPGEANWRQAEERVNVLDPADPAALQVAIANPPPDSVVPPGTTMALYGTAYNAPDRQVLLTVLLENGRVLTEGVAAVNLFGYWELELFIPADASGIAQVTATLGQIGDPVFAQAQVSVTIAAP
jgi:hypothetical protein